MRVPLIEIENFVDGPVLRRARTYFDEDRVNDCDEITRGVYEAIVSGTENYTVRLTLRDGMIEDYSCDCPYDLGPYCKHFVAVCFSLRQDEPGFSKKGSKTKSTSKPRQSIAEKVDDLLEKTTPDELKQFIRETIEQDRSFREMFLATFATRGDGESKGFYKKRIKSILRLVSDRHGFVSRSGGAKAAGEAYRLISEAQKRVNEGNYKSAVNVCAAVMEAVNDAMQYADDSNGDVGGSATVACDLLYEIAGSSLPEHDRKYLIDYCFKAFEKEIYEGWDWHIDMLRLASMLLTTEEELQHLLAVIEKAGLTRYKKQFAEEIIYSALLLIRGEQEAQRHLEQNIANPDLRRIAIRNALKKKDYEHARALANDGIESDRKEKPGLAIEWSEWLLKIAQAENEPEKIIRLARFLFIERSHRDQDYYQIMKDLVPANEWTTFLEDLISDLANKSKWYAEPYIADIYIRESMWDRLFEMVKASPSLESIERYEKHLKNDYPIELGTLYADAVIAKMERATGRPHYTAAARYIRRIKKLGCPEKAAETIATLRDRYPRRPALLEELDLV